MIVGIASGGSPDYLIDVVADGAIRLLGRENVHLRYNRWRPTYPIISQLMQGFCPDDHLLQDCRVLIASRRVPVSYVALFKKLTGGKVAVVDGEDFSNIHPRLYELADIYFLREFLKDVPYGSKVRPLSFGAIPEKVGCRSRDIAVMFGGTEHSSPDRKPVVEILRGVGWTTWETASPRAIDHERYMRRLARARIGVSVRGAGWDTYRYWETPLAGAMLLSQRLGILVEDDFVEDKEAVFFDTPKEMLAKAVQLLLDEPHRAAIAAAGRQAVLTRHLSIHRAARVLDSLSG